MKFFHMIRAKQLEDVPHGHKTIGPYMLEALKDVPWMPWLNQHMCLVNKNDPPFIMDVDRMDWYLMRNFFHEDEETLRQDIGYLDIERPMGLFKNVKTIDHALIYQMCLKHAAAILGPRFKLGVYAVMQSRFWDEDMTPAFEWHESIDPFVGALVLSLYFRSREDTLEKKLAHDIKSITRYINFYLPKLQDRPMICFIRGTWGRHNGFKFVPMDMFQKYILHIKSMIPDKNLVICWFGWGPVPSWDRDFAAKINWIKGLTNEPKKHKEPNIHIRKSMEVKSHA